MAILIVTMSPREEAEIIGRLPGALAVRPGVWQVDGRVVVTELVTPVEQLQDALRHPPARQD